MLDALIVEALFASIVLNIILAAALSIIRREHSAATSQSSGRLRLSKTLAWAHAKIRIGAKELLHAKAGMTTEQWSAEAEAFVRKAAGEN